MNGRCHKDALDRAEDICELCGNQFCAMCLLFPRGHRNPPTCKTCALENSGLRGGAAKIKPLSKREYKKRKKALIEKIEEVAKDDPPLDFFDLKDPSLFDQSTELDRRSDVVEAEQPIDIFPSDDSEATPPPTPTPPPVVKAPHHIAAEIPAPPPPAPTSTPDAPDPAVMAPVDTSVNPLAVGGPPSPAAPGPDQAPDAGATAAELLARLKADQPIASQFAATPGQAPATPAPAPPASTPAPSAPAAPPPSAAPPSLSTPPSLMTNPFDTGPAAAPAARPAQPAPAPAAAAQQPAPQQAAPQQAAPPQTAAAEFAAPLTTTVQQGAGQTADAQIAAAEFAAPLTTAPRPEASQPVRDEWNPPAPPPRGSNLDAMAGGSPEPASHAAATTAVAPMPTATAPDTPERRADTDDAGEWIPPSLRGMTAPDERDSLPKRRDGS